MDRSKCFNCFATEAIKGIEKVIASRGSLISTVYAKVIFAVLILLFSLAGVSPVFGHGGEGGDGESDGTRGATSRGGTTPITVGGGPSGLSRGATGVHSTPAGNPSQPRDTVKIGVLDVDRQEVLDFVYNPQETVDSHIRELTQFLKENSPTDPQIKSVFVTSVTNLVILMKMEHPDVSTTTAIRAALTALDISAGMVSEGIGK